MPDTIDIGELDVDSWTTQEQKLAVAEAEARLAERFDRNFVAIEQAIVDLRGKLKRPPRAHRTGAAARINADDFRFFMLLLVGNLVYVTASFMVSFSGQYAMAQFTPLAEWQHFLIPLIIELPVILSNGSILVFRRRKQSTVIPWLVTSLSAAASSAINIIYVYVVNDGFTSVQVIVAASVMGAAPLIMLVGWEELARLGVKPTGETKAPAPAAVPQKKGK